MRLRWQDSKGAVKLQPATLEDQRTETAYTADAEQAAYFRAELHAERRLLMADLAKRLPIIDRPGDVVRPRVTLTQTEVQLRHIDWLIAQLDSRFAPVNAVNR